MLYIYLFIYIYGFLGGSDGKESACNTGDLSSILGSGRSLGEGNGYPLQYSCLENSMDRGAWRATVHGVTKSQTLFVSDWTTNTHTNKGCISNPNTLGCGFPLKISWRRKWQSTPVFLPGELHG